MLKVPVVMSLRRLLMTGDRLHRIEGGSLCLSVSLCLCLSVSHLHRLEGVLSGSIEFILGAMQKPLNSEPMFEVHPGAEFENDSHSSDADSDGLSPKGRLSFSQVRSNGQAR